MKFLHFSSFKSSSFSCTHFIASCNTVLPQKNWRKKYLVKERSGKKFCMWKNRKLWKARNGKNGKHNQQNFFSEKYHSEGRRKSTYFPIYSISYFFLLFCSSRRGNKSFIFLHTRNFHFLSLWISFLSHSRISKIKLFCITFHHTHIILMIMQEKKNQQIKKSFQKFSFSSRE